MSLTHARLKALLRYEPDTGDLYWLKSGRRAGTTRPDGRRQICVDGHVYLAHRLAWLYMTGEWPEADIDHENTDHGDNKWMNLRDATKHQNQGNRRPQQNESGLKGVVRDKRSASNPWHAQITVNWRKIHLGNFPTPEAAHDAYAKAAIEHFGVFARAK